MILEAAIRVAERDGLDGLTFQALGTELGAHGTAMYRHFRDKDELLLEMIDELRSRSYGDALVSTGSWQDDLRLMATNIRKHFLRHAQFAQQMVARSTHRAAEMANVEFTLAALRTAGLDDEQAVLYLRLLGNYIRAMASFEAAVQCLDPELRIKDHVRWQTESMSLDDTTSPNLARLTDKLLSYDDPRIFDLGLDMIIAGIAQAAANPQIGAE